ncbi:MAG: 50S ribosomal protein L25 [Tenericutes bacterium HGW-Tenericutes-3]|nr:MAG: 50S ribosomal protein L25 [Tenericutes bacterium HGW-Tenericutes-3]
MKLELRTEKLNKVRKMNKIPGVMYGKSIDSVSIQVDDKEFREALKTYGKTMTFKAKLDGKTHNVFISGVETTILKPKDIIHFDLHRIDAKETVSLMIPIVINGKDVFNGTDAYVQVELSEILAEFKPGHGISKIEVDVSKMELGDSILVKDLVVDSHISLKEDLEQVVVSIREVHIVEEPVEEEESGIEFADEDAEEDTDVE